MGETREERKIQGSRVELDRDGGERSVQLTNREQRRDGESSDLTSQLNVRLTMSLDLMNGSYMNMIYMCRDREDT